MARTIEMRNVYAEYADKQVLAGFSCTFPPGITCLMGPSGAGKTTVGRLVLGLVQPTSGGIIGTEGAKFSAVFQENRLLPRETVLTNVNFPLREASPQAPDLLTQVGLADDLGKKARELSGGMARRVELVRALLTDFDILMLDEPFAGLDDTAKAAAISLIRARTAGKTVLCITHDSADTDALGAGVVTL